MGSISAGGRPGERSVQCGGEIGGIGRIAQVGARQVEERQSEPPGQDQTRLLRQQRVGLLTAGQHQPVPVLARAAQFGCATVYWRSSERRNWPRLALIRPIISTTAGGSWDSGGSCGSGRPAYRLNCVIAALAPPRRAVSYTASRMQRWSAASDSRPSSGGPLAGLREYPRRS